MIDYRQYTMHAKEFCFCIVISLIMSSCIAYLFYRSVYFLCIIIIVFPLVFMKRKKYLKEKRKKQLAVQFKECMQMMVSALNAGYSLENAFAETAKECSLLYGGNALMSQELTFVCSRLHLNISIDKILMDLANRSDLEEIFNFCEVFSFARKSGGDFVRILKSTADKISENIEVMNEIETAIAAKKLEQNVMNLVPFGILLYIELTSPEFLTALYGNSIGIAVMSVCLAVYGGAYYLSQKILDIQI